MARLDQLMGDDMRKAIDEKLGALEQLLGAISGPRLEGFQCGWEEAQRAGLPRPEPFPPYASDTIEADEWLAGYRRGRSETSDQPTTQDLILQEVRDLTASQGEFRMALDAQSRDIVGLKGQVKALIRHGSKWSDQIHALEYQAEALEARVKELEGQQSPVTLIKMKGQDATLIKNLFVDDDSMLLVRGNVELSHFLAMIPPAWTGTIQGLEGELTITPPPRWEGIPP